MGENPKKYHVTDDGDVYRINEDGSFTSMGNAEKMSKPTHSEEDGQPSSEKSFNDKLIKPFVKKKRLGLVTWGIILLFLLGGISLYYIFDNSRTPNNAKEEIISTDTDSTSVIDVPLTKIEQPIAPEQSVDSQVTTKSEEKIESHQPSISKNTESKQESETSARSSDNESRMIKQDVIDLDKIYSAVEVQAEFPGGDRARLQWLRDNIAWPRDINGTQLHGDVELEFIIEQDGSVSNVKVTYSENPELNSAAITLISSMPKWTPAMVKNQPVRSPMGITLFF